MALVVDRGKAWLKLDFEARDRNVDETRVQGRSVTVDAPTSKHLERKEWRCVRRSGCPASGRDSDLDVLAGGFSLNAEAGLVRIARGENSFWT